MLKEKYISEAQMKEEPKKKLVLKIKEGSITPEHFNKRLVDEYLISVVDSVEDTGMLPEDKAKLDALPTAEELQQALDEKQNDLTFDSTPTVNSNNPVKSKGIKAELDKKQDKLTNGWVVQIKDEEAGSSGILHKPKLINEDGNEVNVIVGATDRYSGWEQGGDTRIPTIGLVKEKLAAIDVSDQISGKANKSEMSVVAGTGANADKTTITLKNGTSATVLTQHQDVSEFIKEGEVFGTGDDSTASFNPYADTVWNKSQTLSESQKQQIRENIGVGAADNEDIQNVSGELKFTDKAYNTSSHSGLGRKYLRKNIVDNKNVLTQAMVNTANTIYHIQYDYDLNGQTITLPAGCVLKFDGGSISNGTLVGNGTGIVSSINTIFKGEIYISGTWNCGAIYSEWFELFTGDSSKDNRTNLKNLLNLANSTQMTDIYISDGIYYLSALSGAEYYGMNVHSNSTIHLDGVEFRVIPNDSERYSILSIEGVSNIKVIGGTFTGDVENHIGTTGEKGHGILLVDAKNIELVGCVSQKCWGDGIYITNPYSYVSQGVTAGQCENIKVSSCSCLYNRRQGVSIEAAIGVVLEDSLFLYNGTINGTNPKRGIDIEPYAEHQVVKDITIRNCKVLGNSADTSMAAYHGTAPEYLDDNLVIENCLFDKEVRLFAVNGLKITDCNFRHLSAYKQTIGVRTSEMLNGEISGCSFTSFRSIIDANLSFRNCSLSATSSPVQVDGDVNSYSLKFYDCSIVCTASISIAFPFVSSANLAKMSQIEVHFYGCRIELVTSATSVPFKIMGDFQDNDVNVQVPSTVTGYISLYAPGKQVKISNNTFRNIGEQKKLFYLAQSDDLSSINPLFFISGNRFIGCKLTTTNLLFDFYNMPIKHIKSEGNLYPATIGYQLVNTGTIDIAFLNDVFIVGDSFQTMKNGVLCDLYGENATKNGTTAQRPSVNVSIGFTYFDTDLGKMIVWNGTAWVNMDGTALI